MSEGVVRAAGAVCWRVSRKGKLKILVVYRKAHRDVSLPKGKVDPGETLPETAVREIAEETGLFLSLGVPLGVVEYQLSGGREKQVHYWAAEVSDAARANSRFVPGAEITGVRWVEAQKARDILSYPHDIDTVERFVRLHIQNRSQTFALIALRHGQALPQTDWDGPDATRPLRQRGIDQALGIAPGIAAFGPERLLCSPAERCIRTLAPTSRIMGIPLREKPAISQDAYRPGGHAVYTLVEKQLRKKVTTVLCSHAPVLPQIIAAVCEVGPAQATETPELGVGEYAVLHLPKNSPETGVVAIEVHSASG